MTGLSLQTIYFHGTETLAGLGEPTEL
jgi:hypothetical protein